MRESEIGLAAAEMVVVAKIGENNHGRSEELEPLHHFRKLRAACFLHVGFAPHSTSARATSFCRLRLALNLLKIYGCIGQAEATAQSCYLR